jgi:hypothetical protein
MDLGRRLPIWVAGLLALSLVGCGANAVTSAPPSADPTPAITPDPHLREPLTAEQIFRVLGSAKLGMTANNANAGGGNPNIVKQINADIGSWPLRIIEYTSSAAMTKSLGWKPGEAPGGDEAPYAFAALNILITYGPISAAAPQPADPARAKLAASIVAVLDPLLWPIAQRSVVSIPSRTPVPSATPAPSAKPSAKPPAKPSAKPTKAPSKKP